MSAIVSTRCRRCHTELTDRFSRKLGYGPECRKLLSAEELADALRANQPGYVPKTRPASVQARVTNAEARHAATAPAEKDLCRCGSGALAGRCPPCNRAERDPMGVLAEGVQRIIEQVRAERSAERDARYEAWLAAHPDQAKRHADVGESAKSFRPAPTPAEPEQLAIGEVS